MTSALLLRKNHKFKRGLKDKWCTGNASLVSIKLIGKFIEIILLMLWVIIFLLANLTFLFLRFCSSFFALIKIFQNAGQTEINQAIFKTATIVAASLGRSGR
ncbi:hypothetical protein CRG94_09500 [Escherichia sp. E3356]|nr:hypothetical protein D9734_10675 [Escherichia sp. E14S1]TGB93911.1 hypothetical protein CRG94_09500 [Escherichia sp. E3356]